jgi:signal transduction histidine kinase
MGMGAQQLFGTITSYLPRGNTLDRDVFNQRHRLLCWVLVLHLPALLVFGVWRGIGLSHALVELAIPAACLLPAHLVRHRRSAAFFVTAGLVYCSSVIVHLSGGTIEAHFHFFVLIGLIALYQDWVPFLWNALFTVVSHGIGGMTDPGSMYNHAAAQNRPWLWAVIHGVAVVGACVGVIVFWRNTEVEQQRNSALAADLTAAQVESAQRHMVSELFVNLARRNQSLLDRQLGLIAELEQRESSPEALSELFTLDHLATRIRRNAESLLVLSGESPPRRWGRPVPLGELVRAAAAEVEDYTRVDVLVNDYLEVSGRAVADLAHLLAELIENATVFSPPVAEVRVRSHLSPGEPLAYVLSIEDNGVGMSPDDLRAANDTLADPPDVELLGTKLGFHVVGRLAKRYGLQVRVAHTPGGGVTALVSLPAGLVTVRPQPVAVAAGVALAEAVLPEPRAVDHLPVARVQAISPPKTTAMPPAPPAPPAPAVPPPPPATTTAGLVRRVPGAGLAAGLRRTDQAGQPAARRPTTPRPRRAEDRARARAMLSQFQASQRAGRAIARTSMDLRPEEEAP